MRITMAYLCALPLAGCTFCTQHTTSKFEADCQAQGGRVRTLELTQHCVMDGGVVATAALADDDAGVAR